MQAVLHVTIAVGQGGGKWAEREIDLDFVPQQGMHFDCPAWTQKRTAEDVTYNTATGTFVVDCGVIETANRVEQAGVLQAHRDDGWKISTDSDVRVAQRLAACPER
jgi:hypothetical protein